MGVKASKLSQLIGAKNVKRLVCPSTAPRGYVPICVGVNDDIRRFVVHTRALGDAEFLELLCKSAEEYGFCNQGVLRIPYEAKDFEEWMIRRAGLKISRVKSG
ncbi:auxin-responsive protein SAUR40-like [Mercurialis annua]|uniref:auxin-responsive protein SAUR40-like n=1 Tax=Mercurialis annua TaxID=3986 RepID=UPI00215FE4B3|nr:auxin-responsive protein SAUR40-like [Mercurialis annua]